MKRIYLLLLLLPLQTLAQNLQVSNLQCEYKSNPAGVERTAPVFGWKLQSNQRDVLQTAYRILVSDDAALLAKNTGNIWDSKKVNSGASIQVAYAGKVLQSAKTYYWKVMVWDNKSHTSTWSKAAQWQMGLLTPADWNGANWIGYEKMPDSQRIVPFHHGRGPKALPPANDILPLIRKTFAVNKTVKKATMFISGLGHFEMSINGKKVGDHFLDPGWTQYDKQALYVTFDVTPYLKKGANAVGVMLGNGFYYIPRDKRYRKLTGGFGYPKMICRLTITYNDGSTQDMVSDPTWKTAPSPVTFTSIYGGEDFNANLEQTGWDMPSFNDRSWRQVVVVNNGPQLNSQTAEPVKVMETFEPKKVMQTPNGAWLYDLGQNASGIPKITVKGRKGDTVRIYPAELLKDSSANQRGSGGPFYFTYVLKSDREETWQPRFTYYGFRYLQVEGATPKGKPNEKQLPLVVDIKGLHIRNAAATTGSFASSNDLFNRTFNLIDWAIKSNMVSVFTDCPHREKLGWLEQSHLVGSSVRYNYDIASLSQKIISDMRVAQTEEGLIPEIAPEYVKFGEPFRDSPEWGSNAIIMPWYMYHWYGNKQVLKDSYSMMQLYISYLEKKSKDHILTQGLGDWYDIGPKAPGLSQQTPKGITATAIYYYDLTIMSQIAQALGKPQDASGYEHLAAEVKTAFNKTFFNKETKQYGTGSQTANAMAVYMKLVEPQFKAAVVENIVKDIRDRNNSLTAGDIGYRYLLRVLDDEGRSDVIFAMNNRSDVPGYGYQLAHGATALTESWQALGGVSNNHFMLGHILEWFYSGLGGIRMAEDGIAMNKIDIRPEPVGDVNSARASYQSPYGLISTDWKKQGSQFTIDVTIPANTTATVYLPVSANAKITESGKSVNHVGYDQGKAHVQIGSGVYHFKASE